ncbi:MAG: gephyrin-like molybdotransferase Glp [Bacteroidota bacterium]
MISFDKAHKIVLDNASLMEESSVILNQATSYVLAEDVKADRDMPPFFKSSVDGYACVAPEAGQELEVLETIAAGAKPKYTIEKGKCSKIMTGAEIPEGADWVVMVEDAATTKSGKVNVLRTGSKSNIAKRGEDFKKGDVIAGEGTIIAPQHVAVLASVGYSNPQIRKKPTVNILTTGDELVEPDMEPNPNQIRNSNASQLAAQLKTIGIDAGYSGIIKDTKEQLKKELRGSLQNYHITLITGGVSMGDYDFVPDMLKSLGVEVLFHNIAMKPGKPTLFGRKGNHLVFGLPGNPVSSFLQFDLLVKPLIYRMMNADFRPVEWKLPIGEKLKVKVSDRDSWKPVKIRDGKIYPIHYHGSGHIHALNEADGFICIPVGFNGFQKNEVVNVRSI